MEQVLKGIVAAFLIGVLLWLVDWQEARAMIDRLPWWVLPPVLVLMAAEFALTAWKWSVSLRMHGLSFGFGHLYKTICIGYFFNNFLPTAVGGDAYRVYRTLPADGYRSRAVSAVLVERATGLAALLTLGAVAALLTFGEAPVARAYLLFYVLGTAAGLGLLGALQLGWFNRLGDRLRHLKAVDAVLHSLERLRRASRLWLLQITLSFLFQSLSIGIVWWLFLHTGEPLSFWQCALITAASGIAMFLPISINSIGMLEGSFVAMAVALGVGFDQALLVAVLRRLMITVMSLLCGIVYLAERRQNGAAPRTV